MNIIVQLSHPAHFHFYKHVIDNLKRDGHSVYVLIKTKDILETLLQDAGVPYFNILRDAHRRTKFGILFDMLVRECRMIAFCLKHHIDLLTGSTPEVAHVGWLLRKYRINTGEDDIAVVPAFGKIAGPFIQTLLTPTSCDNGRWNKKSIKYESYHELAYLHPNQFTPNKHVCAKYGIDADKTYFLLRFANLNAHHDKGIHGINTEIAQHLIDMLSPHGQIYITSERTLEPQFEQYRLAINPLDMHHVLAFASLYIGDSQTMAEEAAVLGVPSLRFNDFNGKKKIGVLEELEHKYQLTYGINSHYPEQLYQRVDEFLAMDNAKQVYAERRAKLLADKIDYTKFLTWFIENYPQSAKTMRENPDYQYQFKSN